VGGNAVRKKCHGSAAWVYRPTVRPTFGLGLVGHQDSRLWRLYFLIFSDGSCFGGFDFFIFSDGSCFGYCFLVFYMVPATFRVIKS
jgi:hypothetical protein